jgi:hypothetical protein
LYKYFFTARWRQKTKNKFKFRPYNFKFSIEWDKVRSALKKIRISIWLIIRENLQRNMNKFIKIFLIFFMLSIINIGFTLGDNETFVDSIIVESNVIRIFPRRRWNYQRIFAFKTIIYFCTKIKKWNDRNICSNTIVVDESLCWVEW